MTKTILIILVLTINLNSFGQKQYDKLGKDVCNCLEKNSSKKDSIQLVNFCIEKELINNANELKEIEGVESIKDLDTKKIGWTITAYLTKECDYFKKQYLSKMMPPVEKREEIVYDGCQDYFTGEFYYLTPNRIKGQLDSVQVIIANDSYTELTNNGLNTTNLEITWIKDCQFILKFLHSDDATKSAFSKPGDKYEYRVIDIKGDTITLEVMFNGQPYYFDMTKK